MGNIFSTFKNMENQAIRCSDGTLWVTIENDHRDHILRAKQTLVIPTAGKVIVGGCGEYTIVR